MRQVNFTELRALMPLPGVSVRLLVIAFVGYVGGVVLIAPWISQNSLLIALLCAPVSVLFMQCFPLTEAYERYARGRWETGFWRTLWRQNIVGQTLFLSDEGRFFIVPDRRGDLPGLYMPINTGFSHICVLRCVDADMQDMVRERFRFSIDRTRYEGGLPMIVMQDRYGGKRHFTMWQLQRLFSRGVFSEHTLSQLERVTDLPS